MTHSPHTPDTIAALATPQGMGAIAVVRLSGPRAIAIADGLFGARNKKITLATAPSHTVHLGTIKSESRTIDEVLATVFHGPNSYTGEDVIEFSCHGSVYVQRQMLDALTLAGCRLAGPGEFTQRAFLNGKLDLSQAEAVADVIASTSAESHRLALSQMRGGFSARLQTLRDELVHFASLIELELDFSEEDVEFADRAQLLTLIDKVHGELTALVDSFRLGNVIKNGIPVVIAGKPNVGKSTLLNRLLNEERAIVSDIPGTTRDVIEDEIIIRGLHFRLTDTAGIRDTHDSIEAQGVEKTLQKLSSSAIIIYLFDVHETTANGLTQIIADLQPHINASDSTLILVANKIDKEESNYNEQAFKSFGEVVFVSAREGHNVEILLDKMVAAVQAKTSNQNETIVTSARHAEALQRAADALARVREGVNDSRTGDLLSVDLRQALHHLGTITGQITTDDLLENIFSKFCIGK